MLGDRRQETVVLVEDRIDEGVEEEVRAIDPEVIEQPLHASAGATRERSVAQRFVLSTLLADDEHLDLVVAETPPVEHRPEVPAELFTARERLAEPAVVRWLCEQPRPPSVLGRPRVVLPR
jgi:hypothetical protein